VSTQQLRAHARVAPVKKSMKPSVHELLLCRIEREKELAPALPTSTPLPRLVHLIQAAKHLGRSPWTLRHMIARGEVTYHRQGRRVYLTESEIARLAGAHIPATKAA